MAAMYSASPHRVVDGKYKRLRPCLHDADAPSQMTTTAAHRKLDNFTPNRQRDPIRVIMRAHAKSYNLKRVKCLRVKTESTNRFKSNGTQGSPRQEEREFGSSRELLRS